MRKIRNKRNCSPVARTKKTDWERSNAAHKARNVFYKKKEKKCREKGLWAERDRAFILLNYHFNVMSRQEKLKRKLTKAEKKQSYNWVISDFF